MFVDVMQCLYLTAMVRPFAFHRKVLNVLRRFCVIAAKVTCFKAAIAAQHTATAIDSHAAVQSSMLTTLVGPTGLAGPAMMTGAIDILNCPHKSSLTSTT